MRLSAFAFGAAFAVAALTGVASAQNGFVEQFNADAANWRNFNGSANLEWIATGGPDSSGFARSTFNLASTTVGGFPPTVFRAAQSYGSSGSAYVGNWMTAGVTSVSLDFRHDLPEAIALGARFASPANFPGASAIAPIYIQPNTWTTVTFNIAENSPFIVSLEGSTYAATFTNVGNIQIGFNVSSTLAGQNIDGHFDIDNVRIVPAPGALALLGLGGMVAGGRRR